MYYSPWSLVARWPRELERLFSGGFGSLEPAGNRFVDAEPQSFPHYTPIDDGWVLDSQRVVLDAAT
jgi:hypothetical protein